MLRVAGARFEPATPAFGGQCSMIRIRQSASVEVPHLDQTRWKVLDDSIAANTIFELRPTVDDTNRIVDVTMNLGSECATTTH